MSTIADVFWDRLIGEWQEASAEWPGLTWIEWLAEYVPSFPTELTDDEEPA